MKEYSLFFLKNLLWKFNIDSFIAIIVKIGNWKMRNKKNNQGENVEFDSWCTWHEWNK